MPEHLPSPRPTRRATRRALARAAAAAAAAAATTLAACDVRSGGAIASDTPSTTSVGGEVAPASWSPASLESVARVPVAAVRAALAERLERPRPEPITETQWKHARALYRRFGQTTLWFGADGLDERRATALLRALVDADRDALRLDAYPLPALAGALDAVQRGRTPTAEQVAEADVLMTAAYAALGDDLLTGQVNPRTVSQDWHIDPTDEEVDSALVRSLGEPDVDRGIARMRPQDPDYEALRKALVAWRERAKQPDAWPQVPAGRALKPGESDRAARIEALRARLAAEGFAPGAAPAAGAPSAPPAGRTVYDAALAGAVAAWQASHGIAVDSALGPETVKSLNVGPQYRLGQIAANLERHRWMPRSLGQRYVHVNVPAFRLEAYEGGKKALDMKVIVGEEYEGRRTAVFSDTMTTVVFRPYWFVTDDIANQELWPKQRANPGYFAEHRYETFQEGGQTRIRQKPGPENSLGLVKFLFPNTFNIYLHDTPNDALFAKDVRAFSHGCIRLEKPAEFASWVLGLPADSVRRAMETEPDNKEVKVPRRLPVYITYFTAYVQDGALRWGNDLYDRDAEMIKAMTAEAGQRPETVQAVQALRQLVSR